MGRRVGTAQEPVGAVNLARPSEVRALLNRLAFKPSRVLGQNFLIDGNILRIMLEAAELAPRDTVLEIGPGLGVLTGPLLERAGRVIAIEKDDVLHAHMRETLGSAPNLTLLHADALDSDLAGILASGANKVVANLPYSVGTRVVVELCHAPARPERMVVTVQREVADRLAAKPDTKDYGALSVFAQLDYAVSLYKRIPRTCFFPAPQVESAMVVLARRPRPAPVRNDAAFRALVKRCFAHRRKQLGTLMGSCDALARAEIEPRRRPETLSLEEWIRLADSTGDHGPVSLQD